MASCPFVSLLWGTVCSNPLSIFKVGCQPFLLSYEPFLHSGYKSSVRYELQTSPVLSVVVLLCG